MSTFEEKDIAEILLNLYYQPNFNEEEIPFNTKSYSNKIGKKVKNEKLLPRGFNKHIDHFETKNFCSLLLNNIIEKKNISFKFNSNYSLLYYMRII